MKSTKIRLTRTIAFELRLNLSALQRHVATKPSTDARKPGLATSASFPADPVTKRHLLEHLCGAAARVLLKLVAASERQPIIVATLTSNRFQTLVCGLSYAIPMSIGTETPAKGLYEDAL
jgi:hypothetical protein